MINIYDALKSDKDIRITCEDRWLVHSGIYYVIYQHTYRSKKVVILLSTEVLEKALEVLIGG